MCVQHHSAAKKLKQTRRKAEMAYLLQTETAFPQIVMDIAYKETLFIPYIVFPMITPLLFEQYAEGDTVHYIS